MRDEESRLSHRAGLHVTGTHGRCAFKVKERRIRATLTPTSRASSLLHKDHSVSVTGSEWVSGNKTRGVLSARVASVKVPQFSLCSAVTSTEVSLACSHTLFCGRVNSRSSRNVTGLWEKTGRPPLPDTLLTLRPPHPSEPFVNGVNLPREPLWFSVVLSGNGMTEYCLICSDVPLTSSQPRQSDERVPAHDVAPPPPCAGGDPVTFPPCGPRRRAVRHFRPAGSRHDAPPEKPPLVTPPRHCAPLSNDGSIICELHGGPGRAGPGCSLPAPAPPAVSICCKGLTIWRKVTIEHHLAHFRRGVGLVMWLAITESPWLEGALLEHSTDVGIHERQGHCLQDLMISPTSPSTTGSYSGDKFSENQILYTLSGNRCFMPLRGLTYPGRVRDYRSVRTWQALTEWVARPCQTLLTGTAARARLFLRAGRQAEATASWTQSSRQYRGEATTAAHAPAICWELLRLRHRPRGEPRRKAVSGRGWISKSCTAEAESFDADLQKQGDRPATITSPTPSYRRKREQLQHINRRGARSVFEGSEAGNEVFLGPSEYGRSRENPPASGIVRHDAHMRKNPGVTLPRIEPGPLWWEASSLTTTPPRAPCGVVVSLVSAGGSLARFSEPTFG
ncbi:hypothetical protein PR048_004545 [Dryococelus australis]|uniref:Uncharacterized protein n=1 Tax=Dryococelus australis TaxID=614101 RepID=A0ABQ9I5R7_9NEOP|nr:hypothetical protein PR048_004545 [Dryococelus australis]